MAIRAFLASLLVFVLAPACSQESDAQNECSKANVLFVSPPVDTGTLKETTYVVEGKGAAKSSREVPGLVDFISSPTKPDGRLPFRVTAKKGMKFCGLWAITAQAAVKGGAADTLDDRQRDFGAGSNLTFSLPAGHELDTIIAAFYDGESSDGPGVEDIKKVLSPHS